MQSPNNPLIAIRRFAVVNSISAGPPPTVNISIGGDISTSQNVPYLASYSPTIGDYVLSLEVGGDHVVVGVVATSAGGSSPVGLISPFAGSTAPTGWLNCDGAAVSRTTYAQLFTVCGTTYGSGDGSTTFNLPNLTDRIPTGIGVKFARGEQGGSETFTLTTAQLPSHTHGSGGPHTHTLSNAANTVTVTGGGATIVSGQSAGTTGSTDPGATAATGSGSSVNNMPPYLGVKFIVRAL
jgi:microcystin-dependent protein